MNMVTWVPSVSPSAQAHGLGWGPSQDTSWFFQGTAKTGYLVPGVGSGQELGEEGAEVLDLWVPEEEGEWSP